MPTANLNIDDVEQTFFLDEKEFKTGSRGFHGQGKMAVGNGKRYQVNILVVEIGSKNR